MIRSLEWFIKIIKPTNIIGGPGMYVDRRHHYSVTALVDSCVCFIEVEIFVNRKFKMLLSKNDMAELSGMSKDNAGRVLNSFKCEGLIEVSDNKIEILNMESLSVISRIG